MPRRGPPHPLPYPTAALGWRHEAPYPGPPPPRRPEAAGGTVLRSHLELPYPRARARGEQHAEDALAGVAMEPAPSATGGADARIVVPSEVQAYRGLLVGAVLAAAILPILLISTWYSAQLGPEFTGEGVEGWSVGASAQALLGLGVGALIALAVSAGAVPASDAERLSAGLAAAALTAAAGLVWYRVAVVPEPSDLFVREPGLWVSAAVASLGAAMALGYAVLARVTEIQRLEEARASV